MKAGAKRIVLDNKIIGNSDFVKKVLDEHSASTVFVFNTDSGKINIDGNYQENIVDIANNLKKYGLSRIIYHDISANYEFNFDDMANFAQNTKLPVIAAGKLNTLQSIKKLKEIAICNKINLDGLILSKPLYDKTLNLYEVIKLTEAYPYLGDFYSREDIC